MAEDRLQMTPSHVDAPGVEPSDPPPVSELRALFLNCTLKPRPRVSHTEALMANVAAIMSAQGVGVEVERSADHVIPAGVEEDMTQHGFARDDWPDLQRRVLAADILVLGTPIWLGAKSSECTKVIERLYGYSGHLNERGQWLHYGRVAGVVVTGNEDGFKHVAMETLYSLQHLGFLVPPQADCGWIGEAGPGPSYADPGSGGPANEFTRRNTTFMAWNLMHCAAALRRSGGIPAWGNVRRAWDDGNHFGHPSPPSPSPDASS